MTDATLDHTALLALAENGEFAALAAELAKQHPADVADVLQELDEAALLRCLSHLSVDFAADVVLELDEPIRERLVELRADQPERLAELVDAMEADDATDFLETIQEQSHTLAEDVLEHVDDELEAEVRELRRYPPESAGGLMHSEFFCTTIEHTAQETLTAVRTFGAAHDTDDLIHYVFATDKDGRLVGTVDLYKVVLADPQTPLGSVIDPDAPHAPVFLDQEEVAMLFRQHDVMALPVTDIDGKLVGRITVDDVMDVLDEEATEDMYRLAGLNEEYHIFDTPINSIKKRMPWLFVNMTTSLIAASVISLFKGTLDRIVILAVFMPIVAGLGGNVGIQTLTITVRAIALGELRFQNARRAILKELVVGMSNGATAGVVLGIIATLWTKQAMLGVSLLLSMIANQIFAVTAGCVVPLILKRFNRDPALASGIFVTALTDSFGFFAFLGLATILMA